MLHDALSIDRRKLFEQVAAHIEREILSGRLPPGAQLPTERELQLRFGVGRPAVREALILLGRNGLIEISNGTRARVAVPDPRGVLEGLKPGVAHLLSLPQGQHHLQGARALFECALARQMAREADDEAITRLGEALQANLVAVDDRARFIETDVAFHYVIAESCDNPVFPALYHAMSTWLTDQRVVTLEVPGQAQVGCAAHARIHAAIAVHDEAGADAAMRDHLAQIASLYPPKT